MDKLDPKLKKEIAARSGEVISCIQCGACTGNCLLANVDASFNPRNVVRMVMLGMRDYFREHPEVPYACNICELCKGVCPRGLNISNLCLALREQLVEEKIGPLPGHKVIQDIKNFVTSPSFTLTLPDPDAAKCERVWFPGCSLAAYSPSIVIKVWDYLREKLPGTGLILRCCGALSHSLGEGPQFQGMTRELEEEMNKLGASELITGCPECYYTIKQTAPKYRLRGLYEVIVENGLPKEYKGNGQTFSLHDPCKTRWEKEWHESARTLLTLMGYKIEEMKHSRELTYCCGQGGLSVGLNPFRVFNVATERLTEAHFDIVSYCAGCRETFSMARPSVHILDLLFNPDWEKNKTKKADSVETRKKNQAALKSQLESRQKS